MSWAAVAGAAVGVVGGAMNKDKNGGAGSATSSYTPYATGDWIKNLAQQGSDLSWDYMQNPMSQPQQAAFNNQYALGDSVRGLVPGLLGQLGNQQLGFDPSNPTARPQAFDWTSLIGSLSANQQQVRPTAGMPTTTASKFDAPAAQPMAAPVSADMLPVEWAQLNNRF